MGNLQRVFVFLFITVLILTILLAKMTTFFDNVNYTRYLFASKETLPTSQWLMAESISTSLNNSNLTPSKIAALNPTKNGALRRQEDTVSRQTAAPTRYTAHTSPKAVTLESTKNVTLSSVSDGKKYLIYRCMGGIGVSFCSGLGNREIGIVASYLLANATNRTFGVIMKHPCDINKFLVPNTHNWTITPEQIQNLTSSSLSVRNNRKFTNSLTNIDFNRIYPQDVVYILNNQEYHLQLFQNKLYRKNLKWARKLPKNLIYRTILDKLFKLHPNVEKKKNAFLERVRPSPQSKLICAQVRMGKNPSIPWDNRPMNTMKGVEKLWNFFDKKDNASNIFITTDSSAVIRSAKKRFNKRFVTTDGPIIHIDKAYRGSPCSGMEKLILDQMILKDCDTLVVSTSSFGRIPAYWRNKPSIFLFRGGKVGKW